MLLGEDEEHNVAYVYNWHVVYCSALEMEKCTREYEYQTYVVCAWLVYYAVVPSSTTHKHSLSGQQLKVLRLARATLLLAHALWSTLTRSFMVTAFFGVLLFQLRRRSVLFWHLNWLKRSCFKTSLIDRTSRPRLHKDNTL